MRYIERFKTSTQQKRYRTFPTSIRENFTRPSEENHFYDICLQVKQETNALQTFLFGQA